MNSLSPLLASFLSSFTITALLVPAQIASAEVIQNMTKEWVFYKPVAVTGDNLDGDDASFKKLCIAPTTDKTAKKCYDANDNNDGMTIEKWNNTSLSFFAPADIPVNGIVFLKRRTTVEKCYGPAACEEYLQETEKEIGSYMAIPFAAELIDVAAGGTPSSLKADTTYTVKGAFFGTSKGSIFLQLARGSKELDASAISAWSFDTITFKTPADVTPIGFSINNGIAATKYELGSSKSSSSASSVSSASSSSRASSPQTSSASNAVASSQSAALFLDVDASHPYKEAIRWAKESGIVGGYPDGTFHPDWAVNRAEFLKIVLRAKGVDVAAVNGESGFSDVDGTAWFAPYVAYAKTQGFVQGYNDGMFKPNQIVNVAESLKMAYTVLDIPTTEMGGEWYERFLRHAKTNKVLYITDMHPASGMSREDLVWIMWHLVTRQKEFKGGGEALL